MGSEIVERFGTGTDKLFNEGAGLTEFEKKLNKQEASSGEILFITSYPPRECGIASYSLNLINALNSRFSNFFRLNVCALENGEAKYYYPREVTSVLNTTIPSEYIRIANQINKNSDIQAVVIQHEFDLFKPNEFAFQLFLNQISKPIITVFHTVIPKPSEDLRQYVQNIAAVSKSILVMAKVSENTLINDYQLSEKKIEVIPYGTHLISPSNIPALKEKYKLSGRAVLSTIGLLAHGKGIENTLEALPAVIKLHPEVIFLIIGKTHPEEFKKEGEKYRIMLEARVKSLKLQNHVQFLNGFFTTETLKEYFLLSDISIFSCTDTNRPMSGIFSLAVSCGCSIISTPTSHAYEFLDNNTGLIFQGKNPDDLSSTINQLIDDPALRKSMSEKIIKKSHSAIWENSALSHGKLFNHITGNTIFDLNYPPVKLDFIQALTDRVGILHTTYKGEPDLRSGYTLDDNALALYVFCMHFKITCDTNDIPYIKKYLKFIYHCFQPSGTFLKYLDFERKFTARNSQENLEETQAKALWALGYVYSMKGLLSSDLTDTAGLILGNIIPRADNFVSGKAIALAIKGLYYYYSVGETGEILSQVKSLADKLVQKYNSNTREDWKWFEEKFPDSASILPGALLNTWLITGDQVYREIATESFKFLSSETFHDNRIEVKSRQKWFSSDSKRNVAGEQPYDIAFNVITLSKFYLMCKDSEYFNKMDMAFKWFLGNNRLSQMVYNPLTGSCFDCLEEDSVCLNQSAEAVLSYTLARMMVEKYKFIGENHIYHTV